MTTEIRINPGVIVEISPRMKCGTEKELGEERTGECRKIHSKGGKTHQLDDTLAEYLVDKGHATKVVEEEPEEPDARVEELKDAEYRDLQAIAKKYDLAATGSANEIRERITAHLETNG